MHSTVLWQPEKPKAKHKVISRENSSLTSLKFWSNHFPSSHKNLTDYKILQNWTQQNDCKYESLGKQLRKNNMYKKSKPSNQVAQNNQVSNFILFQWLHLMQCFKESRFKRANTLLKPSIFLWASIDRISEKNQHRNSTSSENRINCSPTVENQISSGCQSWSQG